jgi:chromate transporter
MDALVETAAVEAPDRADLRHAFGVWAQVSAAGVGGAALQLATMHRLLVQQKRWISEDRFFHALSCCIALPGPETQQLSFYIGWLSNRMIGGIVAGGLFILPGIVCMMALSFGYVTGGESQVGQAISLGVRPAILAVMVEAIVRFGGHVVHSRWMAVLAGAAFVAAFLKVPFPIIMIVTATLGTLIGMAGLSGLTRPESSPTDAADWRDELSDHTRPNISQFVRSSTFWLLLWLAPPITLIMFCGFDNIFTQISILFGKVSLMALGGDYAVVIYAAQQAVDVHHWLSARDVQDGIAMGEMVPGTIMIVTQFLGSLAAYRDPGALPPLLAGALGGLLATWMTFCPCFLFITAIAPYIEGMRRHALLSSTLQAVTAAAIGMILNLSVWFGIRTMFRHIERGHWLGFEFDMPDLGSAHWWSIALFVGAAIAILRFKAGTVKTLAVASALGIVLFMCGVGG